MVFGDVCVILAFPANFFLFERKRMDTDRYGSTRIDTDRHGTTGRYGSMRIDADRHGSIRIDTDRCGSVRIDADIMIIIIIMISIHHCHYLAHTWRVRPEILMNPLLVLISVDQC